MGEIQKSVMGTYQTSSIPSVKDGVISAIQITAV